MKAKPSFISFDMNYNLHSSGPLKWYISVVTEFVLMRRSIRNFNIPPPGIPRAFDCASCPGRGEFECCVGRVGNLNRIYLLFWRNTPVSFFGFLQGLTDLKDRMSLLLVNNSVKRVFKRRWKVLLRPISLWKACEVFDWRRNLSLKRGSSVLIGGAFERLFCPDRREFEQANLQKFKCPGGCPGGGCWTFELIGALRVWKKAYYNSTCKGFYKNCKFNVNFKVFKY